VLELVFGGHLRLTVYYRRTLGRRSPDVEVNDVGLATKTAYKYSTIDARRRPGLDERDEVLLRPFKTGCSTVRLHRGEETSNPDTGKRRLELLKYFCTIGCTYALSTAVLALSYSRHARVISCDALTATSGSLSRR